jgi:hypothetical protein
MRAEEFSVVAAELDSEPSDLAFTSRSEDGCSPAKSDKKLGIYNY